MRTFEIRHELPCDPNVFWDHVFFDPSFNRRMWVDALEFPTWDQEVVSTAHGCDRRVKVHPSLKGVPKSIQALFGSSSSYVEEGTFDRVEGIYRFRCVPSVLADRIDFGGQLRVEARGSGMVERIIDVHIAARVLGLGAIMEQTAERIIPSFYEDTLDLQREAARNAQSRWGHRQAEVGARG